MNLKIVKMNHALPPFAALYYVGEGRSGSDGIDLTNPIRCVEFLRQRQVPSRVVGAGGQQEAQMMLEPTFQDLPEASLRGDLFIPKDSIMTVAALENDLWFENFYSAAAKDQQAIVKNMTAAPETAPPPQLSQ